MSSFKIGDNVGLLVYNEVCCDLCNEVVHNHIDCPVCEKSYSGTNVYDSLYGYNKLTCDCGTTFEIISGSWYYDCIAKIVSIDNNILN